MSETAHSAHGRVCRGCLVSETARSAHGRVFRGWLVSETVHSAHERVCQGRLVSEKPHSAHGRVFRGCLVSGTVHSAHGRVFRGCLVGETARSAHGRVCRGYLVSETARSAHGRVFRGCLVGETAHSAHERVCRCASGRRRVCVVTEESRHPYLRNSACTAERQNGTKVSPKRASLHSRATISAKSVALECRLGVARGRILERSKEHKWMVLLLSKTKTHTTVALYGENAAVVIGQGSGGAFQGI